MAFNRSPPFHWASLLLAAFIVAGFVWRLRVGDLALQLGFSPAGYWGALSAVSWPWQTPMVLTPLTALFVHLDWLHLLGNWVFLLLFAPRIEQQLRGMGTICLFCLGGAFANVAAALIAPTATAPIIGASGATSTLIGAFVVFYPREPIGIILPLGLYWQAVKVPGLLLIGTWAALQLMYTATDTGLATIAWWTHIAGFAMGLASAFLVRVFRPRRRYR